MSTISFLILKLFQTGVLIIYNKSVMKFVVVGAGVSGIIFAISRKKLYPQDEVIVLEHLDKPLKKVLATGNGKCNIGNVKDMSNQYDEKIVKNILMTYDFKKQKQFLDSINIKTKLIGDLSYPITESAVTVRNALLNAINKYGVKILTETTLIDYEVKSSLIIVKTNKGDYKCDKLIFATAGKSSPKLGSDGSIIPLLEKHNYKFEQFRPVLCPIHTKNKTKEVDGTRVKANVSIFDGDKLIFHESGEVLFKDRGLSGIVIFNASRYMKDNKPYEIKLDLLPEIAREELYDFINKNGKEILLETYLHPILAKWILKSNPSEKDIIEHYVKALTFIYDGNYGFENSHVSAGGIRFIDLNDNLESKTEKNVHFIGEILDYDAPCGGYNLMWAIATGLYLSKIK